MKLTYNTSILEVFWEQLQKAQWEKAARGTDGRTYPWEERIDCTKANIRDENSYFVGDTKLVGSYPDSASP